MTLKLAVLFASILLTVHSKPTSFDSNAIMYKHRNNLKSWKPIKKHNEDTFIEEPILTSSMEDMIKKTQKQQYTKEELANTVKELWGINKDLIEHIGSSDVHPTTVRNKPNFKEEERIRIDNFFRKRKQNVKLRNSVNDMSVNLAVYLSYIHTEPNNLKSTTINATLVDKFELSTTHPVGLTLQSVHSKVEEKIVDQLISEVKSQFAIEGNTIKLTDLQKFLMYKVIPRLKSNNLDNTFMF